MARAPRGAERREKSASAVSAAGSSPQAIQIQARAGERHASYVASARKPLTKSECTEQMNMPACRPDSDDGLTPDTRRKCRLLNRRLNRARANANAGQR